MGGWLLLLPIHLLFNPMSLLKKAGSLLMYTDKSEKEQKDSVHKGECIQRKWESNCHMFLKHSSKNEKLNSTSFKTNNIMQV